MSTTVSSSKKRKQSTLFSRDVDSINFSTVGTSNDLGPALAVFPAIQPPAETPFQAFRPSKRSGGISSLGFIRGSTDAIEYSSLPAERASQGLTCRYLVGVYDKSSKRVRLYDAPTHIMERSVKVLKKKTPTSDNKNEQLKNYQLRNELGQVFGSRKAIKAIRAAERNVVDVAALRSVTAHIQHGIEVGTSALPDKVELEANRASSRPIPPINQAATKPNEVYNVYDVVTEAEMRSISVEPFISASSFNERRALIATRQGDWVLGHLRRIFDSEKLDKTALKFLIAVASMIAFRLACRTLGKIGRSGVEERLKAVPDVFLDGLFDRFTEQPRGEDPPSFTQQSETRLLTHMFTLCLRLDGWYTMSGVIADDLAMDPTKVLSLFRTLGCSREEISADERNRQGWSTEEARNKRPVRLKLPLVFPKEPGKRKHKNPQ